MEMLGHWISGLGDVTEENVGTFLVWIPDSSVELIRFGELMRCGLGSLDSWSTKKIPESIELIDIWEAIFKNR